MQFESDFQCLFDLNKFKIESTYQIEGFRRSTKKNKVHYIMNMSPYGIRPIQDHIHCTRTKEKRKKRGKKDAV